jgi:hypothetical protein
LAGRYDTTNPRLRSPIASAYCHRAVPPYTMPEGQMQEKSKITLSIRPYWIATITTRLLCIFPILVVQNPPLHDYPFHIARMYILTHWHESTALQDHYTIGSFILPNAAMDIAVPLLSHVIPLETAGRVFLALALLLQVTGCVALHRSLHARYSLWPLVSSLFVFNWIFVFGFTNYLFGIGLVLWSVAIWFTLADRSTLLRIACGTVLSTTLFFCHLHACGLFAVIIAGYELQRAVDRKVDKWSALASISTAAAIFVVPAILFVISTTAGVVGQMSHSVGNLLRAPAIFIRVLFSADWTLDIILLATVAGFFTILLRVGRIVVVRAMYLPIVLLFVTYLAMPHVMAGSWGADSRIPVLIMFVLIASTQPTFRRPWEKIVVFSLLGVVVLRSALLTYDWFAYDRVLAELRQAFALLPHSSVLFSITEDEQPSIQDIDLHLWQPPLISAASLAAMDRDDIFVPQTFAILGQQPIGVTERYQPMYNYPRRVPIPLKTAKELDDAVVLARGLAGTSAYLLVLYPHRRDLVLPSGVQIIAQGDKFLLLALKDTKT